MDETSNTPKDGALPPIPDKRYFSISEVAELCLVKPHVLRFWEQAFPQLKPKKRENRRFYVRKDIELIRKIRDLLYVQLFTIKGARVVLEGGAQTLLVPPSEDFLAQGLDQKPQEEFNTQYHLPEIAESDYSDAESLSTEKVSVNWLKQELQSTLAVLRRGNEKPDKS